MDVGFASECNAVSKDAAAFFTRVSSESEALVHIASTPAAMSFSLTSDEPFCATAVNAERILAWHGASSDWLAHSLSALRIVASRSCGCESALAAVYCVYVSGYHALVCFWGVCVCLSN